MADMASLSLAVDDPLLTIVFHYENQRFSFRLRRTLFTHTKAVELCEESLHKTKQKDANALKSSYCLQYEDFEKDRLTISTAADFLESLCVLSRPSVSIERSTHSTEYEAMNYYIVPIESQENRTNDATRRSNQLCLNELQKDVMETTLVHLYDASLQLQNAVRAVQTVLRDSGKERRKALGRSSENTMSAVTQTPPKEQYHTEAQTAPIDRAVRMTQTIAADNTARTTQTPNIEQVSIQTQISPFARMVRVQETEGTGDGGRDKREGRKREQTVTDEEEKEQSKQQEEATQWVMPLLDPNEKKEEQPKKSQWVEKFHSIVEIFPTATYASIEPLLEKHNGNLDLVLNELMEIVQ